MAKVQLILENEKEEKVVFEKTKIKARAIRKAIEANRKMQDKDSDMGDQLDALIEFTVDLFDDKKVTEDSLLDGLESDQIFPTLNGIWMKVMGIEEIPDPEAKK
ncbi:phage tail assembly chaperone G [Enterococcus alishanensis]